MADKQDKDREADVDLDLLDLEVGKEIDNLFVPAAKAQPVSPEGGKENGEEELPDSLEMEIGMEVDNMFAPAPKEQQLELGELAPVEAAGQPIVEDSLNLDNLQIEIDKEIDSLFIPAAGPKLAEQIEALPPEQETISLSMAEDSAEVPVEAKLAQAAEPDFEKDDKPQFTASKDVPGTQPDEQYPSDAPTGFKSKYPPQAELPKLVEEFNAAYLSLDWEFSSDNIRRLEYALQDLESFAISPGSATIYKILKAVLSLLGANPESANNRIVELIRDSQGLLAHLLLTEGPPGSQEKERINAIVGRFRQMRQKATAVVQTGATEPRADLAPVSVDAPVVQPEPSSPAMNVYGKMPDRWSLLELRTWMESSSRQLIEAAGRADKQLARIRQIESALGKSEALSPVVVRLEDIRAGLERTLDELRGQSDEWMSKAALVENLEKISVASEASSNEQVEEREGPQEPQSEPPDTRDLWIFRYSGRLYGIPAANLVKSRLVPGKKAREIFDRGYGTLADVKQFFRSISAGVAGRLLGMPGKDLKNIKFDLIGPEVFQSVETPSEPRLAIFVTDGRSYGLILSDSEKMDFQVQAELNIGPCSCRAAAGTVRTDSGACVEVLDVGQVFKCEAGKIS